MFNNGGGGYGDGGGSYYDAGGWGEGGAGNDVSHIRAESANEVVLIKKRSYCCGRIIMTIVTVSFIIAGALALIMGVLKYNGHNKTIGTIIGTRNCNERTSGAIIEYTIDGTKYTINSGVCGSQGPTIGKNIRVLYDPAYPQEGLDASFIALWLFPLIFLGIGIPSVICQCYIYCWMGSMTNVVDEDGQIEAAQPNFWMGSMTNAVDEDGPIKAAQPNFQMRPLSPMPLSPADSDFTTTSYSNTAPHSQKFSFE